MTRVSDDSLLDFLSPFQITISLSLAFDKPVIGLKAKLHNTQSQYLSMLLHYDLSCDPYQKQAICCWD